MVFYWHIAHFVVCLLQPQLLNPSTPRVRLVMQSGRHNVAAQCMCCDAQVTQPWYYHNRALPSRSFNTRQTQPN